MAMKARLFVDGEYYNIKSFEYGFVTGSNANGFSSGKTRQVGLSCEIEAIRQELFEEWAFEDFMKKYVEVHMEHTVQGMGKTRVLKCHETFLLEFNTQFSSTSEEPLAFELFMKTGAIEGSWSTASHIEKWSSLPEEGEVTVIEEELEGRIIDFYTTNQQGERITKFKIGDIIYVNVESENKIGDEIVINLADKTKDFKYRGQVLENDTMDYQIRSNKDIIELEVIPEN